MWQRIQTLYLGIAIVLNLIMHGLSLASLKVDGLFHDFTLWGLISAETGAVLYSSFPLLGLNIVSVLISLIIIFLFKKRQLQIKLSQLNLFVQVGLVAAIFFMIEGAAEELQLNMEGAVEYGPAALISMVPLLFIYLAIRAVKKDEALVRAADRIR
ncbi:MAG: DUF4293 domain-containing protein [Vicingaceae bacterium]